MLHKSTNSTSAMLLVSFLEAVSVLDGNDSIVNAKRFLGHLVDWFKSSVHQQGLVF